MVYQQQKVHAGAFPQKVTAAREEVNVAAESPG